MRAPGAHAGVGTYWGPFSKVQYSGNDADIKNEWNFPPFVFLNMVKALLYVNVFKYCGNKPQNLQAFGSNKKEFISTGQ